MADLGGMFGYSFGGDFANSFAKGIQLGLMQRQIEMNEKKMMQDYEMNHLLREEMGLKVRAQRNALEEANRYRQQWDEWKKPMEITHEIPAGGDEFSGPTDMRTETLIGPSKLQQMFPGQTGQILEMGGPDMLKAIAPKLVEDNKPISDIGKLQYDRQQAIAKGYPVNHPYIQAIDRKIAQTGEMTDYQRESLALRKDLGQQGLDLRGLIATQGLGFKQELRDREKAEKSSALFAKVETTKDSLNRLSQAASEVMNHPGIGRITGITGMVPNVPGLAGANAQAALDNLKAQAGFTVLQNLRDMSKTGGALGQVSDFENKMLQAAIAALDTKQSTVSLQSNLKKIIDYVEKAKGRIDNAYRSSPYGGSQQTQPVKATFGPQVGDIDGGYRFRGGDPSNPNSWEKVQ